MPSVKLYLGKYVTVRQRKDGSSRVLMEVPPRLRPSGWCPAIPLPRDSTIRRGNLQDEYELAFIRRDATQLYEELIHQRTGHKPGEAKGRRSMRALVRHWQASSAWKDLRAKTKTGYQTYINKILAWSDLGGDPDPALIKLGNIESLLAAYDHQPVTRKQVRKVVRLIMRQAVSLGWRVDNPASDIRLKTPKAKFDIWEQQDVDAYVAAAERIGRASIALIILLEWEIGQRLTDVRGFRKGAEYNAVTGQFMFSQSKTGADVTITVSTKLRGLLTEAMGDQMFLFREETTGKAYTEERLSRAFGHVRKAVGGRYMQLRWLRHSCVVQLARAGCEIPEIAAVTGHQLGSVTKILENYLPRDGRVAANAQAKRGIV